MYKLMGLDCWDRRRDARRFAGAGPVIAHPPCRTWGNFRFQAYRAPADEHATGPFAIEQVRRCGGVLEHPVGSTLFAECGCGTADSPDQWGGWTMDVDQFHWGHKAAKPTRLYIVGCRPADVPAMPHRAGEPTHCISQGHGIRMGHPKFKSRITQAEREATPPKFAEWLVELASKCVANAAVEARRDNPLD